MPRPVANFLLLLAGLAWGMGFVAQQSAMTDVGPMLFIALRFTLAAVVVLPFALYEGRPMENGGDPRPFNLREWLRVVLLGTVFFFGMAFQQVGLLNTSVTNAGMLTGLYVILVPILILIVWREWQHPVVWPAAAASVLGIWLLGGSIDGLTWGDGLIMVCAFCWACHVILMGKTAQSIGRPVRIATAQFAVCGTLGLAGHAIGLLARLDAEPAVALSSLANAAPE
ncbi:MAG: DMT family transporter, partial [Aeoliella sp.]